MKRKTLARFIIFLVIGLTVMAIVVSFSSRADGIDDSPSIGLFSFLGGLLSPRGLPYTYEIDEKQTLSIQGLTDVSVSNISSPITIYTTRGDEIIVHLVGEYRSTQPTPVKLVRRDRAGQVIFKVEYPTRPGIRSTSNMKMEVFIPISYTGRLSFNTVSSNVSSFDQLGNALNVKTVSGAISLHALTSEKLHLETVSGSIIANYDRTVGSSEDETTLELVSVSGNIRLALPESSDFSFSARSVSGRFSSSFAAVLDSSTGNRHTGRVGEGYAKINAETVSGSITIEKIAKK